MSQLSKILYLKTYNYYPIRMDKSFTAQIGVHRKAIYSLAFSPDCEILIPGINKLDFDKIKEIITTKPDKCKVGDIYFNLEKRQAIFPGIQIAPGKYIVGNTDSTLIISLPATKEEILYVFFIVLHMFGGEATNVAATDAI
jgi:hypothetical protein